MRRMLLLVALLPLAAGCGGGGGSDDSAGAAIFTRAQEGIRRLGSSAVHLHVRVETPVPVQRSLDLYATDLPKLDLTGWVKDPRRTPCCDELECAKADLDVQGALQALEPVLPSLPVDPQDVRSAIVNVAVDENGLTRYVHVHGTVKVPVLGEVPFEADLDSRTP